MLRDNLDKLDDGRSLRDRNRRPHFVFGKLKAEVRERLALAEVGHHVFVSERAGFADFQPRFGGQGLELRGLGLHLLIQAVGQALLSRGEFLLFELGPDPDFHLIKRLKVRCLTFHHLDDVNPVHGLDEVAHLPGLH